MSSWLLLLTGCGYDQAFNKAEVDKIEITTIPASTVIQARADGNYFSKADQLFMRLFKFIKKNEISMTTPVEGGINDAAMTFYVGAKDQSRNLQDSAEVAVLKLPERKVVRIGGRGGYSIENLQAAEKKLTAWLETNRKYIATGKAYGVFWNSPFVPNMLKRYEVHIPIQEMDQ